MALPHVADVDSLQTWKAAANVFSKQLRRADKGWSCGLSFGEN
jgi:hypothetical protein